MISIVCTLCTAAHAISEDRAAKMQRTALMIIDLCYRNAFRKIIVTDRVGGRHWEG
jgi:hypothetical protein